MKRRHFVQMTAAALFAAKVQAAESATRPPRILLRSSWQVVNIGDIAHTPGVLALIEKYIPNAEVRLWASGDLTAEVAELEHRRFPRLKIVKGTIGNNGQASNADLADALDWTDFLLHGSGASFVAAGDVASFVKHTGKPFGIYGITYSGSAKTQQELMSQAKFIFFRDSVSLAKAKSEGIKSPVMEFGPDGAFGCDLRNDTAAETFLKEHDLTPQKFVCCIPRLRYTPYWLIKKNRPLIEKNHARNEAMKEHDHAPLRDAIAAVVRQTDHKVLLCPEDMTQVAVGKEMLFNKLPDDVKKRVVWRDKYWLTDEALSTYVRSAGLFGLEMHSPIMCIGNGVPAIVGRFAEQTTKGIMWRDIGLGDWLFDMDEPRQVAKLTETVLSLITDRAAALEKTHSAQAFVQKRQQETMRVLRESLPS